MAQESEPTSIGGMMVETRDAIARFHDAHAALAGVGRRIRQAHDGEVTPTDAERFEWEMARGDMKHREAELIRAILAWRPSHAETARGEACRPGWKPRGVIFEGITYVLFTDSRCDDDAPETTVLVDDDAHDGPPAELVWRLESAMTDELIDLDDAFA